MIFQHNRRIDDLQINLTPLIDVVFLLLIFFMVSTTFNRESEITIDLPEASGEPLKTDKFVVEISIDGQGRYFINQQRVIDTQASTLKRALRLVIKNKSELQLIISADKNTPHQAVITAMDTARQLGLYHLTFATKQAQQKH